MICQLWLNVLFLYPLHSAPDDYANSVIPLTFGPTRTSQEVSVPIVDDDLLEDIETFFGNLRFAEVFDSIQFAPSRANASISGIHAQVI